MKTFLEGLALVIGVIILIGLASLIVPTAAYWFLILFGVNIPFWKIYVGFLLFAVVMNWFSGFFNRGNNNE